MIRNGFSVTSKDKKAIIQAVKLLLAMALGIGSLFLIFWIDAKSPRPFSESAPMELIQSCVLLASSTLFFIEAIKRPNMRSALVLTGGLLLCMFIREQDNFLDTLAHGVWKWPAIVVAFLCIAFFFARVQVSFSELARLARWRYVSLLIAGLVIVLLFSRLLGMGMLWQELLPNSNDQWIAKRAMEESSELLGYFFILLSAILLRFGHK